MQRTELAGGRGWLDAPAASSLARIDAEIGHLLQVTDAGRSFFQQEQNWLAWLNGTGFYAAEPGTSPHEFGNAIDTDEGKHIVEVMERHGWRRPLDDEPWHWVYWPHHDQHRNDPAPPTPESEEDDDMAKNTGIHWKSADGRQMNAIVNTASGYFQAFESSEGGYNSGIARAFESPSFERVSESHAQAIERACAAVRPRG